MRGFFKEEKIYTKEKKSGIKEYSCKECGLNIKCKSPKMPPSGKGKKGILVLAEASGKTEDLQGIQLIGQAGQLLRKKLTKFDIDLEDDCIKTNSCACRPVDNKNNNRTPTDKEIKCCRANVLKCIEEYNPNKIILLGTSAVKSIIGDRTKIGKLDKWVGLSIPDQKVKSWLFPTYHPSYLLRDEKNKVLNLLFERHLEKAIDWGTPFPNYGDEKNKINIITNVEETKSFLLSIIKNNIRLMSFDYETTGLKPHKEGHKIICLSISYNRNSATAFPMFDDLRFLDLLKKILTDPIIKKVGQNIKYEENWTNSILGYKIENWYWDTMIASHCLDNRQGITGLKFQTYARYGTVGYQNEVESYLKSEDTFGANTKNKLEEYFKIEPIKVLVYSGMDSMFTFRLYEDQEKEFRKDSFLKEGYDLFLKGTKAFSEIELSGINIDTLYYTKQDRHLLRRIEKQRKEIDKSEESILWKNKENKNFNPDSDPQLNKLLFKYLDYTSTKTTKKGSYSADKDALIFINTLFTKNILLLRKLEGIEEKIDGVLRETVNGILRPMFDLNTVRTFRSSSSHPNSQNFSKRDEESKKIIRTGIIPRKGYRLLTVDYGKLEVCISACYHKDPQMITYLTDPSTDMHRDQAMELFLLNKEDWNLLNDVQKEGLRYIAKNSFVFAEFYGSYFIQITSNIWKEIQNIRIMKDILLIDFLKKKGITNYNKYEEHVEEVEYVFWKERFKVYAKWKEDFWKEYQKKGYFESLDGFRYVGLMKKNDVLNYGIQGFAFHILLYALIQTAKFIRKEKLRSKIIGQIHDEMMLDVVDEELESLKPHLRRIMCKETRKHFKSIIVPLDIEAKTSEIDGNWFKMKKEKI